MTSFDKFTAVFFFSLLIGGGYLIYTSANSRQECVKVAMSHNRSAEDIKSICR